MSDDSNDRGGDTCFDIFLRNTEHSERPPDAAFKASFEEHATRLIDKDVGDDSLTVQCDMTEVIHGAMDNGEIPATLIVFQFVFLPRSNERRIEEAHITITFSAGEIIKITPSNTWAMFQSRTEQNPSHSLSPSLGAALGPANATVGYAWQLDKSTQTEHCAIVEGVTKSLGQNRMYGRKRPNTVIWTLRENGTTSSGIPSFMQAAVLVQRESWETKFGAEISIRGQVDSHEWVRDAWRNVIRRVSGSCRKEAAVIFNPELVRGEFEDVDNLKNVDLQSYTKLLTIRLGTDGTGVPSDHEPSSATAPGPESSSTTSQSVVVSETRAAVPSFPASVKGQGEPVFRILNVKPPNPKGGGVQRSETTEAAQMGANPGGQQYTAYGGSGPDHDEELVSLQDQLALVRKEALLVDRRIARIEEERRLISEIKRVKESQPNI